MVFHVPSTRCRPATLSRVREPSLPQQYVRTRRFSLGAPRDATISPAGDRVVFLRSPGGADPTTCLWELDVVTGQERLVADPALLAENDVPDEERRRRERAREAAGGVVAYAVDRDVDVVAFALGGNVFWTRLSEGEARVTRLPAAAPALDPRPDPTGTWVAYVCQRALRVLRLDGSGDRTLAEPEGTKVSYGLAEFVAAEEMGRVQGYWWAPDGSRLLVARVDESPVQRWHLADPAKPATPPVSVAYPAAGTANAEVSLWVIGLDGARVAVRWDHQGFEYVVAVQWHDTGLFVVVQSRDQQRMRLLQVDPDTGVTTVRREDHDPAWLEIVPGVPAVLAGGSLVWTADLSDTRRLLVDNEPVTPPGLQVRAVLDVDGDEVLFAGSEDPTEVHVWAWSAAGGLVRRSGRPGVHTGRQSGGALVLTMRTWDGTRMTVQPRGGTATTITSYAETPVLIPRVQLLRAGERELRTAVLLPTWHLPGSGPLPVLMDPYGGPAAQMVMAARNGYLISQWFAEQGFAVVVADGRGTPGRGPLWERSIHRDIGDPVLQDQVDALHAAARQHADLDLSRVGIRGWSFGGYLAALAVLRRPDAFHAAVAGAPVTDQRLYDTHYQERYLGHPDQDPQVYDNCSLIADAPRLERPLMLVHGLADDNVSVAHTLRLSAALLAAGRPHTVLPLSGVTHMANQEDLLLLELDFLRRSLAR